jgi:hypothetical protein
MSSTIASAIKEEDAGNVTHLSYLLVSATIILGIVFQVLSMIKDN